MASSSDTEAAASDQFSELSSVFQRLLMRRDVSLFLPFILGFTTTAEGDDNNNNNNNPNNNNNNNNNSPQEPSSGQEETSQSRTETNHQQERIILINPFTQGMVVIEGGAQSLESLLSRDLATSTSSSNNGQPPASKASIEAMPTVEIGCEDKDGECVICLEEWELVGVVKVMPCKHRFHPICIEKWLGIHGSCPVCRYKMPVDEQEFGMKREEGERMRRRLGREIWVSFSFNGSNNRRNSDSNQNPAVDSDDVSGSSSSSSLGSDHQMEG